MNKERGEVQLSSFGCVASNQSYQSSAAERHHYEKYQIAQVMDILTGCPRHKSAPQANMR